MLRRRRRSPDVPPAPVDPAAVSSRFAPAVRSASVAHQRYHEVLAGARPGPVRDRLVELGERLEAGVAAVGEIAARATRVEQTLAALDPERVTDEYKRAKRSGAPPELERALAQRFAAVQRLLNTLDDTDGRLRLLDARLGAMVATAAEIALGVTGTTGLDALGTEIDGVLGELGALRTALDEMP